MFLNKEIKRYAYGNKMNFTGNKNKLQGTKKFMEVIFLNKRNKSLSIKKMLYIREQK
jgi:hypothetical protein